VIVDQMGARRSKLTYDHLPKGTVMGMSFHSNSLMEEIKLGQSSRAVKIFKGDLSDEEVFSYLTLLNNNEEKRGLSLILEDKENESVPRDENLWIQLKETTGFQPGSLSRIITKIQNMDQNFEILNLMSEIYLASFIEINQNLKDYRSNLSTEDAKGSFNNFLISASNSLHFQRSLNPQDSLKKYWDCRFVVCDDEQILEDEELQEEHKHENFQGIPLSNPKALSKPVARGLMKIFNYFSLFLYLRYIWRILSRQKEKTRFKIFYEVTKISQILSWKVDHLRSSSFHFFLIIYVLI